MLTPEQVREGAGVVLLGAGLLCLVAMFFGGAPLLEGIRRDLLTAFGAGWPLPVVASIGVGAHWIWPDRPGLRWLEVGAGLVSALALLGLMSLVSRAGGRVGAAVAGLVGSLAGPWGGGILLTCALALGLIVVFHFSPGRTLVTALAAGRRGYAERRRLDALVRPRQGRAAGNAGRPVREMAVELAALAAAGPAGAGPIEAGVETIPPHPAQRLPESAWRPDDDEQVEPAVPSPVLTRSGGGEEPDVLRVIADPIDDIPPVDWKLPPISLLDSVTARKERMQEEIKRSVRVIEGTLATFGVQAKVIGVNSGPAVTQYELQPAAGVAVKRIVSLQNDLSLALAAAPLRIEAPIPGKSAVGIEVPNKSASLVSVREMVESTAFRSGAHKLAMPLGNDVSGQTIVGDITRMPHLLIAGATGQGKSVCINVLIASLILRCTPEQLRFVMIDPKRVELNMYNGLPHLAVPVIVEAHQAASALRWAVAEMDRRYKMLSAEGVRNIAAYNEKAQARSARELPYIVIVVDELADLMMVAAGEIEELVCRIAQLARAVGIHLVIATQRPSTDIITGLIKANIPSRIAFAVGSQVDSRVILDSTGAEKLLGRGDMLYQPVDAGKPTRIQGAFISDQEIESLVGFWQGQGEPRFIEEVLDEHLRLPGDGGGEIERRLDPLFARAARTVAAEGAASVSLVQRKFNVGYSRAGRIVDQLADQRVVGAYQGSKSREVLMNLPDVDELLERLGIEG